MKRCFFLFTVLLLACTASRHSADAGSAILKSSTSEQTDTTRQVHPSPFPIGPAAILYKTKSDYHDKVPVTLNDDKTQIVSYPAPKDVIVNGLPAYPAQLDSGYLLDNLGISPRTAYLNITLEEYSHRSSPYSMNEMMRMITEKQPFTIIYNCGNRRLFKDVVKELNNVIDSNQLNKYMRIL